MRASQPLQGEKITKPKSFSSTEVVSDAYSPTQWYQEVSCWVQGHALSDTQQILATQVQESWGIVFCYIESFFNVMSSKQWGHTQQHTTKRSQRIRRYNYLILDTLNHMPLTWQKHHHDVPSLFRIYSSCIKNVLLFPLE